MLIRPIPSPRARSALLPTSPSSARSHVRRSRQICPGAEESRIRSANSFASAFLLPRRGFIREFPRPPVGYWPRSYWQDLFEFKRRWRVSVAAIVRRAFDLRMIDAAQYQRAYKFMSGRGWLRQGEPAATEPEMEVPELLPRSLSLLASRCGISQSDIASALHWKLHVLEKVSGIPIVESLPKDRPPQAKIIHLALVRKTPDSERI